MTRRDPAPDDGRGETASRGLSIRTWVLFATTMAALPLLGFAVWIVGTLVSKQRADDQLELRQRSQAVSLAVKRRFDTAAASLQALAVSPAVGRGDVHELYA